MGSPSRRWWLRACARAACAALGLASNSALAQLGGASAPDPQAILTQAKEASGGAAWDALRTQHSTVTIIAGPLSGRAERWSELASGRSTIVYTIGPVSGAAGFDAQGAWTQDASGVTQDETHDIARELAVNAAYRDRLAFWYPQRAPARISYKERAEADGATFHVIRITPEGGRPFELWINTETMLIERLVEREVKALRTELYMDMRRTSGVMVPFRVRASRDGGQRDEIVSVDTMAFNTPVSARQLIRPPPPPPDVTFPAGQAAVEVPFDLIDGHVFVHVALDGKRVRMLLDSGGSNVLLPKVATAVGARVESGPAGGELGVARVARVTIGGLVLERQVFATIDLGALLQRVEGIDDIGGVLGAELFRRVVVKLDYLRSRATLFDPARYVYGGRGTTLALIQAPTPRIRAGIDGIEGVLRVDTGSRASLTLAQSFATANGLAQRHRGIEAVHGASVSGPVRGTIARMATLTLGNIDIAGPVTAIAMTDTGALAEPDVAGSIGNGILRRFDVVFDVPHKALHLDRNASFAAPDVYDRAGMWLERGQAGLEVVDVVADGPASVAGLVPGDVVVAVDGRRWNALPLAAARAMLKGQVGRKLRLTLDSGAVRIVTLRDLL